jgi:hypothetical protein
LSAALPETANRRSFHPGAINTDQSKNYAVINLPSGTKAKSARIGECAYTIPEVGEKVAAKGENTFADGTYYYFIANTPTASCFGCGTYWAGIKGDGTTSGEVTATGHVLPSVKCEATELATIGDDVWYYNGDNVKTGIFADLAVYNKSIGTFVINMDSATIGDTGISPNLYGEDSDQPVIRVQLGDSPPHTTSCGATPSTNEMVTIDSFPGGGAIFKMSPVGVMSNTVSGARILMGTDVDGGGLYSFVPFVGSTFLLETLTYNRTTVEGSAPRTALHAKFGNLNAINMEEPFSGLELYADNKYFVYTNVSYDKHDSTDGGKNSPWRLASDYWRTSYDAFGATIDQHTKKIYLKLNHSTGPTTQPLGLTGGGFYMHPYEEDWKYPVGEYVKVVATGFCD